MTPLFSPRPHPQRRGRGFIQAKQEKRTSAAASPAELPSFEDLGLDGLRREWRRLYHCDPPRISRDLLLRGIGYRLQ